MRPIRSVLATLPQTKKPQRHFIAHLLGLLLMLPGHATFRNLSLRQAQALQFRITSARSRAGTTDPLTSSPSTRWPLLRSSPPDHQQALVIGATFIAKNGTHTYGLERFWNSRQRRSEKGLEVSAIA